MRDPVRFLIDAGLATPPQQAHRRIGRRDPIKLSRPLDEIVDQVRADHDQGDQNQ